MMRHELQNSRAVPGFSCLKMKQELQERVYRETEGMTDEEIREYIHQGAERFDHESQRRKAATAREPKYKKLADHLKNLNGKTVVLTFSEIEKILGDSLPKSAKERPEWWNYSKQSNTHPYAKQWTEIGYKALLKNDTVEFVYQ